MAKRLGRFKGFVGQRFPVYSIEATIWSMPKRRVRFSPAVKQFRAELTAAERSRLKEAIRASLLEDDAAKPSGNRFLLRRASAYGSFEFRVDNLRVFYRIVEDEVRVTIIGRKAGSQLLISGKKVQL
jgi:mRNA-degrading endonuclease RelE of RelBE toxin-antitoxin system